MHYAGYSKESNEYPATDIFNHIHTSIFPEPNVAKFGQSNQKKVNQFGVQTNLVTAPLKIRNRAAHTTLWSLKSEHQSTMLRASPMVMKSESCADLEPNHTDSTTGVFDA